MIPVIDARSLFAGPGSERAAVDALIAAAAESIGFFCLRGPLELVPTAPSNREQLLRVFSLPDDEQRNLWRTFYEPTHHNVYRGWNPRDANNGVTIYDLGPDVALAGAAESSGSVASVTSGAGHTDERDPLLGPTPLPPEASLPGWLSATASYYRAMERVGAMVMRSVARGLELPETFFDHAFVGGISTLRLMRYEFAMSASVVDGEVVGGVVGAAPNADEVDSAVPRRGEHIDSGFVTLLCQHGVAGLSAKARSGDWVDVPPVDGQLVVNFGGVLERWTEGRIRATPHRVVSEGPVRFSIPFFFEPRVDAVIAPLPTQWATPFEPFTYGDHLWAAMSKFPNFAGVADLREPRGVARRDA